MILLWYQQIPLALNKIKIEKITEVRMLVGHCVIQVLLESHTNVFFTVPATIPASLPLQQVHMGMKKVPRQLGNSKQLKT